MKVTRRRFPQPLPLAAPTPGPAPAPVLPDQPGPAPRPSVLNATMPTAIPQPPPGWRTYSGTMGPLRQHPALARPQHARPVEPPAIVPNPGARDGELGIAEVDGLLGDVLREIAGAK